MENLNYVIHLFHSGGYVMYPLLLLSFMVIAIAAERAFYYHKYAGKTFVVTHAVNELAKLQNWAEIDKVIKENPSIASRIAEAGFTVTISPLLGLLGTVTGMIGSFSILDSGAGASAITGGVGEALIATASGLCVAIMAFIVYTVFSHRLDAIINQIENMCVSIVSAKREGWK
ncbi:MAG: MotA/TolQ/ExbB proton channel family protein [Veillonella sp.]|nr:MotA/TolQ/ExbB proton channel family protein [Veillonella sp.]